jgi:hypothetical protein
MRKKRPQDCFRRWSEKEDELVRELFLRPGGIAETMEATGRTHKAIRFRASRLGFRGPNNQRYVMRDKFKNPPPARPDLLESMKCPGNGRGCGNLLRREMVPSGYGYIAPGEFDLVCVAGHRFRL